MKPVFKFDIELFDEIGVRAMAIYDFLECIEEGRYPKYSYHLEDHEQAVFDDKKIEKNKKDEFLVLIMNELFEMLIDAVEKLKLKNGE